MRLAGVVYVLHTFQKKSKRGIQTTRQDIGLIRQRLKVAEQHYREQCAPGKKAMSTDIKVTPFKRKRVR